MKLLHTADLHIGMTNYSKFDPESGLESRLVDFFKTFDYIIETAIKQNVDAFIFAGDAYKSRDPSPTQQKGFGEAVLKLTKAGIPVILVVGNHDTPTAFGKANTLDIYSALEIENVWVARKMELLNIPTKSGNLQVITVPWFHKSELKTIAEKLSSLYAKIKKPEISGPTILAGHLEVEGASMGSEKGLTIGSENTLPLSLLLDRRLSYVALGHIHKHQVIANPTNAGPLVVYCGSPERIDFGEEKEEKGFILVNIEAGKSVFRFTPSKARKFITITINLKTDNPDPTQTILKEIGKHQIKDSIVKVIINIPDEFPKEIEIDKIKKTLSPAHVIASISKNIERAERIKIDGQEEVERLTPIEAMRTYFKSKNYSAEKIKNLEKYAAQILES